MEVDLTIGLVKEALTMPDELDKVEEVPAGIENRVNRVHKLPLGVITSISPFIFR